MSTLLKNRRGGWCRSLYFNWKAFSPKSWKIGTLNGLFRRGFLACSEKSDLEKEINHLKFVFAKFNGYPLEVVFGTRQGVKNSLEKAQNRTLVTNDTNVGVNSGINTSENGDPE